MILTKKTIISCVSISCLNKLYQTNRFHIVFKQIWFNKIYYFCLPKCINITILMILWEKILFHVVIAQFQCMLTWYDLTKKIKLVNGSEKVPNFGNQESKYDITYIKFLELKNGLDHHSGSKYERFLLEFTDLLRICFYY